ncbi:MAG TPA: hypothetical protein VL588_01850 [Bdellovibrionota bacterium]|jgi:hypothetical protein|nr:hypothetical protein [Bdellovibrionota bacterium]
MARPELSYRVTEHRLGVELVLSHGPGTLDLADRLRELEEGGEVSVSMASGSDGFWRLYFKLRPEGTRLLLAHPEPEEWVATLALEPQALGSLIEAMTNGGGWAAEDRTVLHPLTNVHFRVE